MHGFMPPIKWESDEMNRNRQGCLSAFMIGLLAGAVVFLAWDNLVISVFVAIVFFVAWLFD